MRTFYHLFKVIAVGILFGIVHQFSASDQETSFMKESILNVPFLAYNTADTTIGLLAKLKPTFLARQLVKYKTLQN